MVAAKKINKHTVKDTQVQKKLLGRKVLYIPGAKGTKVTCPVCGVTKANCIVSEMAEVFYCSERCCLVAAERK